MEPETLEQFLWDLLRGMTHLHMKAEYYADTDTHSSLYAIHEKLINQYDQNILYR